MEPLAYILFALMALYVAMQLLFACILALKRDKVQPDDARRISILVAARNEEVCILNCLQSLARQHYPAHLVDIHIGDDASTDATASIILDFIQDKPQFHYHHIDHQLPGLRGKHNVLAQLAHHAQGEIFLITDADVVHTPQWAAMMVGAFHAPHVGVVSGPTLVHGPSLFTRLQGLDWVTGLAVVKGFQDLNMPVSPVGNNMAVSREAYWVTGGYAHIPFHITEDYALWQAIRPHGYRLRCLYSPQVLNLSQPIGGLGKLLQQRKRWFRGGSSGPWYALAAFAITAMAAVIWVVAPIVLPWQQALSLLAAKLLADALLLTVATARLRRLWMMALFLPYQVYLVLNLIVYLFWFPLPGKVSWKGRRY